MQSSVAAFLLVATICNTWLVSGLPLPRTAVYSNTLTTRPVPPSLESRASQVIDNPALRAVGLAKAPEAAKDYNTRSGEHSEDERAPFPSEKRASDDQTAGGNAYTGSSGNVSSGDIYNIAGPDSTITNNDNVGIAGQSLTGNARGGEGKGRGPGGNAYTGDAGDANGGSVHNDAGVVENMGDSNNAGQGGVSQSGIATGGGN
ncbi:unnamed protein product [Somion occarium]|uniref:Uncharacterized protein n=1 Tax=Somion occarium TaxID=3059160 RepID=A0ABP1CLK0_9APHY